MLHQIGSWNEECWMEGKFHYCYLTQWNWNIQLKFFQIEYELNFKLFSFRLIVSLN
jgi:hypothetical protein